MKPARQIIIEEYNLCNDNNSVVDKIITILTDVRSKEGFAGIKTLKVDSICDLSITYFIEPKEENNETQKDNVYERE